MSAALALDQHAGGPQTAGLREALLHEAALLRDLLAVVLRQRAGVTADDLQAVDDSVYAAHRVLRTLEEARRRRRTLLERLVGSEDIPLDDLDAVLGEETDAQLLAARDDLVDGARVLSREIAVNRKILRQALTKGEAHIRTLCGAPATSAGGAASGLLVNRRV